ncbi:MAG: acyl-CoA dehydrogenase family protein [Alphaproteobacteria bacterium]|nr:acyl-CoA dehydrogenase family protein [Alphaproteobacteria bacterium]MDP6256516.1 acyl-CoA dehydrogenase family protein [Alphaproteobacteria bacterium]MDP7056363.1 acyl-CoA dehydrogenase family protein [Alphaproteobacteria bacterium]MDP7228399.1 acyl-CoA dehydrogenase family protein [Alphaproteobacteria bacterium]HJM93859.1 acyl-CoA dehydrogenase family protein [Alphaproteobacteria bacterium]
MTARSEAGEMLAGSALENARAVAPVLRAEGSRIEVARALTPEALAAMHEGQLFRLSLPRRHGGAELPLPQLAQAAEIIGGADASAAWCLGQALGCAMTAAFMDEKPAREVFDPADAVLAWGAGIQGKLTVAEGGYLASGTWRFASGSHNATWLGGHSKVFEADGSPRLDKNGKQANRTALFPRAQAEMADDWHVMGLRGTRSEAYTVENLFIPEGLTSDRETEAERRVESTLFLFPTTAVYASLFSSVALGIAQSMFDDLVALARKKTPRGARNALRDSPVFQTKLAELEAQLGSPRAYKHAILSEIWETVDATGELSMDDRARIRLCTTYAINQATAVSEQVYHLAGSTAIFENEPFERRFRDIHAVSQQVQARHTNYETVGRYMLGHEADTVFM